MNTATRELPGFWTAFFWAAAIFNFVIGLAGMFTPEASLDGRVIGLLVFAFGIVYFFVARDALRFAPALWAGVFGKVGVVALLAPGVFNSPIDPLLATVLIADGLFALGFLLFLLTVVDRREV